ncbi:MAG TPA: low molecular weight protein-tyrosine-phosphatase [Rhodocyclaceae bacterium]|nr:low molecular weight protein-tyrosine-phosphatase [Rhodocyclaceae bacterium]
MVKVLFVCMGNICRSPTAEGVLRVQAARAGLAGDLEIDSAGTHGYHVGAPPDVRAQKAAAKRGYNLSGLRARRVAKTDFLSYDLILAMDQDNLSLLREACPEEERHRLGLFLDYARNFAEQEVPDPYYGGPEGFERVLDLIEDASIGLIETLRQHR